MVSKQKNKKTKIIKLAKSVNSDEDKNEFPKKSIQEKENKQLFWFFVIIVLVFMAFLIPYFWTENLKSFEHGGADWMVEDYENFKIYHGRFMALNGANLFYNVFLRGDPRKNNVPTEGIFDKFKYGGIVSFSPEVDKCRGDLSRVMLDLGAFLKQGVGVGQISSGSTDESVANETNKRFAQCETISDRTLIIIEMGDNSVTQNKDNPFCYTIKVENCDDISSVEKFIIKTIDDFTLANKISKENSKTE